MAKAFQFLFALDVLRILPERPPARQGAARVIQRPADDSDYTPRSVQTYSASWLVTPQGLIMQQTDRLL